MVVHGGGAVKQVRDGAVLLVKGTTNGVVSTQLGTPTGKQGDSNSDSGTMVSEGAPHAALPGANKSVDTLNSNQQQCVPSVEQLGHIDGAEGQGPRSPGDDEAEGTPEGSLEGPGMVDVRGSTPSMVQVEAKDLPGLTDQHIPVVCNEVKGAFLVAKQQVVCNCKGCLGLGLRQRLFTPCQFERHAGSKAKKWKISIKLDLDASDDMLAEGDQPLTIGQWYDRHGIEVKPLYKKSDSFLEQCPSTCSGGSPRGDSFMPRGSADLFAMRKRKRPEGLVGAPSTLVPASYPPRSGSFLQAGMAQLERSAGEGVAGPIAARNVGSKDGIKQEWPLSGVDGQEDGHEAIVGLMQLTRGPSLGPDRGRQGDSRDAELAWRQAGIINSEKAVDWKESRGAANVSLGALSLETEQGDPDGAPYWRSKFDALQTADSYYKHKVIFQLMYSIMEGADKKALYEEYLPILNDMDAFRLEQEFNTLYVFLDLMQQMDFEAIKCEIRCYVNGVLKREFRKLTSPTTVQLVPPQPAPQAPPQPAQQAPPHVPQRPPLEAAAARAQEVACTAVVPPAETSTAAALGR